MSLKIITLQRNKIPKKIKDVINTIYDKKSSLPENGNIQVDKKTVPINEDKKPFLVIGIINDDL